MKKNIVEWGLVLFVFFLLFLVSKDEYLVFHFITETFTILVAGTVFAITLNTRKYFKNQYMIFIGISYLFIAILDLFHTLTYTGMPIYEHLNYPANQLWIAARFYESVLLLLGFSIMYGRKVKVGRLLFINTFLVTVILASILWLEIFPTCYIEGVGQTTFKVVSEYVISLILIITAFYIFKKRHEFSKKQYSFLIIVVVSTIFSELLFTFYISNYGISNLFGHYFKVISFIFVYKLIIKEGLQDPYSLIFKELEESKNMLKELADSDPLTKLLNRRSLIDGFNMLWRQSRREDKVISVLLIDIDDFKVFNDSFGHTYGDMILVELSSLLKSVALRPMDLVSRYGGEEFVVTLYDCPVDCAWEKSSFIHNKVKVLNDKLSADRVLSVSIGFVTLKWKNELTIQKIIQLADDQMYLAKQSGKNITKGFELEE